MDGCFFNMPSSEHDLTHDNYSIFIFIFVLQPHESISLMTHISHLSRYQVKSPRPTFTAPDVNHISANCVRN